MIFLCFLGAAVIGAVTVWFNLIKPNLRYDIVISNEVANNELICGTKVTFRRDLHELELTNPETRKTTVVVYRMYQIKRVYWRSKDRKGEN